MAEEQKGETLKHENAPGPGHWSTKLGANEDSFSEGQRASDSNAPPTTMMNTDKGMKDTYEMSPNELRKYKVAK